MTVSLWRTRNVRDAVLSPRPRETDGRPACGTQVVARWVSRSGRIATVGKAVRRRGPGRVVLGSKPQLATAKQLVRWAGEQAAACGYQKARALGRGLNSSPQLATTWKNSSAGF